MVRKEKGTSICNGSDQKRAYNKTNRFDRVLKVGLLDVSTNLMFRMHAIT